MTEHSPEQVTEPAADAAAPEPDAGGDLRARLAEAEDQRLRALAWARASADVAAQWLPVVDNLDRALSHSQAEPDAIIEGVRAVRDQALAVLAGLGFARRDDTGQRFDPARHDAVATRPDPDADTGTVVEVMRAGYGEGDHQLRPAQVVVAA